MYDYALDHGELGEQFLMLTQRKCSSSNKTSPNDHPIIHMKYQIYEALIIQKIHLIVIITKPRILGLFNQFIHFGKTVITQILRISSSDT